MTDKTVSHEEWEIACAAWVNVPVEDFRKSGRTMPEGSRAGWERVFKAVTDAHEKALAAEGMVIVPREPTDEMFRGLLVDRRIAAAVYRAMITAYEDQ